VQGVARIFPWDMTRNVRDEVDLVTHRTPDYQLSSATDWNPGRGGDQHDVWQAPRGPDAVCFTTHPGPRSARSPGWWTGSATLPRVAQIENVLVAIYRIPRAPALMEITSRTRSCRATTSTRRSSAPTGSSRRRDSTSRCARGNPSRGDASEANAGRGGDGSVSSGWRVDGSFADFVERIAAAPLAFGRASIRYGRRREAHRIGWRTPLRGTAPSCRCAFARYDAPWVPRRSRATRSPSVPAERRRLTGARAAPRAGERRGTGAGQHERSGRRSRSLRQRPAAPRARPRQEAVQVVEGRDLCRDRVRSRKAR
jgi:hypothetical protein